MKTFELVKLIKKRMLFWQFATVLTLITVCAVFFILYFVILSEESSGKGSAINVSGSLRMQSYVTALTVAQSSTLPFEQRKSAIEGALAEFKRRLLSPGLIKGLSTEETDPLRQSYEQLHMAFFQKVEPLAEEVISNPERTKEFMDYVPSFVSNIDQFVSDLEDGLERRMSWVKVGLITTMVASCFIGLLLLWYFQRVFFKPLTELADVASQVRRGNFLARSSYDKKNEIGKLSGSFNYMIEDLARMYQSLEDQVQEKTADLDERNRTLNLLFSLRSIFSQSLEMNQGELAKAVEMVRRYFSANSAHLVLHRSSEAGIYLAASAYLNNDKTKSTSLADLFSLDVSKLDPANIQPVLHKIGEENFLCVPIKDGSTDLGTLFVSSAKDDINRTTNELLVNIGEIFATALKISNQKDEGYRLAVYEERSTIARELHDSIAQSLAYTRIQLARLSVAQAKNSPAEEIDKIVDDLKLGITTANSQLRQVLTTFRLKPSSTDLRENLRNTLEVFHERSGIAYTLDNQLFGFEVNANQQIHLIHILSEALSNIEKHAHASHVQVVLTHSGSNKILMTIADDGVGFEGEVKEKVGHFGLSIMQERAQGLGGVLNVSNNLPRGAKVSLEFETTR
ncbi:MAG: histidine kinase [Oscillospiraceae bacterium]|nr:histidine kinase [Oscillospiraceae bacterium]